MDRGINNRINLENITTITIDPLTAKDFDDALSIKEIKRGLSLVYTYS